MLTDLPITACVQILEGFFCVAGVVVLLCFAVSHGNQPRIDAEAKVLSFKNAQLSCNLIHVRREDKTHRHTC